MKYSMTRTQGFTLVEVSIAGLLLVVLGTGILGIQYIIGRTQIAAFSNFISGNEANIIVNMISREIRTARAGDNGSFLIENGTANAVTFYSDVDYDGQVEKVQYSRSGNTLTKNTWEPSGYPVTYPDTNRTTRVISQIVRNGTIPMFSYYNGDWPSDTTNNPLSTPVDLLEVKSVRVYVRTNERDNDANNDFTAETQATLRMAKDNL